MKNFWRIYVTLMITVNATVFMNQLDQVLDFMTWSQYDAMTMLTGICINIGGWMLLAYPLIYGAKKLVDKVRIKKIDKKNFINIMSLM